MSLNPLCERAYHEVNIGGSRGWRCAQVFVSLVKFDLWIDQSFWIQPA